MKELVEFITKRLVDHPEDVEVRAIDGEEDLLIEVHVHPDDMGRIIGRNGKTAKAIRTLLSSAGAKARRHVSLKIAE